MCKLRIMIIHRLHHKINLLTPFEIDDASTALLHKNKCSTYTKYVSALFLLAPCICAVYFKRLTAEVFQYRQGRRGCHAVASCVNLQHPCCKLTCDFCQRQNIVSAQYAHHPWRYWAQISSPERPRMSMVPWRNLQLKNMQGCTFLGEDGGGSMQKRCLRLRLKLDEKCTGCTFFITGDKPGGSQESRS